MPHTFPDLSPLGDHLLKLGSSGKITFFFFGELAVGKGAKRPSLATDVIAL